MFKIKYLKYLFLYVGIINAMDACCISFPALMENPGERTEIDSLLKILPASTTTDRLGLLLEISKQYISFSMDSSREYARLALMEAKELNDTQNIADAYKMLGNINYYQGNYNEVLHLYDSSARFYDLLHDSGSLAKVWNNLGIIYASMGDYEKSVNFHLLSISCKTRLGDSLGIANSYNNIGSIYYDLKDYEKSQEYFLKALFILEKNNYTESKANIYNNLGLINQELHQYEKSIMFFNKSLAISELMNDKDVMGSVHHNIGKSNFMLGDYQNALDHYFKAIDIFDSVGIKNSQTLNNIGQVYIELDYYRQAQKYLFKALEIAKKNNQFIYLRDIYNNLAVTCERLNQYNQAYHYYILFNTFDDSVKNQMYSSKIENIYNQNELENKQKEIEKLNIANQLMLEKRENDRRKQSYAMYSFIAGIVAIFIIALILYKLFRQKTRANLLLKKQNEEIKRSDNVIKKINKALAENEDMLRRIFDASPSAIMVMDMELKILDCNNASLKMFTASNKRDIISKSFSGFFENGQSEANEDFTKDLNSHLNDKSQFSMVKIDGLKFMAELSGGIIKDASSNSTAYVVIISDITERNQFIENLNQAKIEAEESDRLKTAFLANMSHEIRTPMNSIIGFSNLLSETELVNDKKEEYLKHILQSSNILLNLIDDIIDISKIEAGQLNINLVESNVNKMIREVFSSFTETKSKGEVEFRLQLPPETELLTLNTDSLRLRQIITNLLGNALKFTEKGTIDLGYSIKRTENEKLLEFYVKDTGIGIPLDKQTIIFERFRQVDEARTRKFGGTGLGLAISKRLVNLLGGTIWVKSEINKGSAFYFTLPLNESDNEPIVNIEPFQATKYNWKGKTILVAEDENSNFELLKASIYRTGIKIIRAFNGDEAVEFVKKKNGIDIVLMDIRMPRMNGYDATRIIKGLKPELPVISITAYAMSEDKNKSLEAGCDMYISKPIRPSNLLAILNDFIPFS
jgi:PAS domain S-box-containing protein